jgi:DNA gyrase inhibitor GyrI/AraC-like DNA-binding protein
MDFMRAVKSLEIYQKRINRVIDYINNHLTETLSIEKLARLAYFSPFHFHRIFRSLVGEPLHAFVQRLRLEKAVTQMLYGPSATLTKIALQSGFASSSDFSRTFKQRYGFSPSRFSRERFLQESKIRQDLLANAGYGFGKVPDGRNPDRFRVRLVDRPAQWVAYVRVIGSFDMQKILSAFDRLMVWGKRRGLIPEAQLIGMTPDDPDITPMKNFRFDWCLVLPEKPHREEEMSFDVIPANRFAVVRCRGDLQKEERGWRYLFHTWLPASGYQPTQNPAMEVYRKSPLQIGWETFDIDCCLPVRPLRGC